MKKKNSLIIFTDLDGTLLHRETFKFDPIKDYIKELINNEIIIIPNSSKTEKEIEKFNEELGIELPYISENGSSIHKLNLINSNFPNKIILSREKEELIKIFNHKRKEKINLIGQDVNNMSIYEDQNYILHIYGKKNVKPGRKMGHFNRNIS